MKLLLIHQLFAGPEDPGGTRHYEIAKRLIASGHDVTVITSGLCYLSGKIRCEQNSATSQSSKSLKVLRVPALLDVHRSYGRRAAAYLYFVCWAVIYALQLPRVDVVMGTSPPLFQLAAAWLVAKLWRCPLIVEVRDLWPDFAVAMGVLRNPVLIWFARRAEKFFYAQADALVVNSPAYIDHLLRHEIQPKKIHFIPNGVDPDVIRPLERVNRRPLPVGREKFTVMYAGAIGPANDVAQILNAAALLSDIKDIHFVIAGDGKERTCIERTIAERRMHNVTLMEPVPKSQMSELLSSADVFVATLLNISEFRTTFPNKVFDYMAAARPTVLAIDGVIRDVLVKAKGGLYVSPGDARAMADAILWLKDHPLEAQEFGQNARNYVSKNFHRDQQGERFLRLLATLDSPRPRISSARHECLPWYKRRGKRLADICMSIAGLLFFMPLLLIVAASVFCRFGKPVLFADERTGRDGATFVCWKFRTMTNARDSDGELLPDELRLVPLGRLLRRFHLDELPQLWNVLKGEMSIVGPRPLPARYASRYSARQFARHRVSPGITGWAQILGRNALSWQRKFELDLRYVEHFSARLDAIVILQTIIKVLLPIGISAAEFAPAEEFGRNDEVDELAQKSESQRASSNDKSSHRDCELVSK